ncbi:MAG: T9SS type A sorting domain-containing protein [candidate division Zixibacteria bacterium]|nr:T9SS type A sorting domain-containing protein [candidate division Zixibacteria bacterium]
MEPFAPSPGSGELDVDPGFVDPDNGNYFLDSGSLAIGSGRYGDCRGALQHNVWVTMIPDDPVIEVAPGSAFRFTGILQNGTELSLNGDVWIMLQLPGGSQYGPLHTFNNLSISPYARLAAEGVTQEIPSYAPTGIYSYIAYVGYYPGWKADSAMLQFTVTDAIGGGNEEWLLHGWFGAEPENLPLKTAVLNSYPNPFNARTTIEFQLSNPGDVNIDIYNLAGQKIADLTDDHFDSGSHIVTWDASDYSSGIYFYRFKAGETAQIGRMTLVK